MGQVGDLGVGPQDAGVRQTGKTGIGAVDLHAGTVKHQLPGELGECGPGPGPGGLDAGRGIGVGGILHIGGNVKVALFRVGEGQVV